MIPLYPIQIYHMIRYHSETIPWKSHTMSDAVEFSSDLAMPYNSNYSAFFVYKYCISRNFSEDLILALLARLFSPLRLSMVINTARLEIMCLIL